MTVDIAHANLPAPSGSPSALVEWAAAAQSAHNLADALCRTAFCPDSFRGKAGEATAAILTGSELGLSPMAALNAFDVIQGRPAPKAMTLRALALSHGHELWPVTMTPTECVMRGRRRGTSEVVEVRWTIQRARDMRLTDKPNWKNQPQAMLVARATSEMARLIAADVLLGVPYSSEELADLDTDAPEPKRTAKRRTTVAEVVPPPEPDLTPADTTGEAMTSPQSKKLHAILREQGHDRDSGLALLSGMVGRTLSSTTELTKAEASDCIDALEQDDRVPEEKGGAEADEPPLWPEPAVVPE